MSEELIVAVKQLIIDALRIEGMAPADIDSDAPLFGDGLGLDSIDALQLVVAMEKEYGVVVPDAIIKRMDDADAKGGASDELLTRWQSADAPNPEPVRQLSVQPSCQCLAREVAVVAERHLAQQEIA